jgi:hypothetical protein
MSTGKKATPGLCFPRVAEQDSLCRTKPDKTPQDFTRFMNQQAKLQPTKG